jgi:VWFA-related protein
VLHDESIASYAFFDRILREDRDLAFVIEFATAVDLLQDLTPSRLKLEKALRLLQGGGATKLYDAIRLACDELMKPRRDRKALVLLTNGIDNGSASTLHQAIESAQRSDTLVYSILFAAPPLEIPQVRNRVGPNLPRLPRPNRSHANPRGRAVLQRLAHETGGGFFEVSHSHPLEAIFVTIEEELRNQYSIGYTSDQQNSATAYRHIHLIAKMKGLSVQARDGYYPA